MSSKRGRKVNKDLPPSRARDVQRAFRARRAAHLEALEERVAVLEQENALLRAALKLPPSERPLLGRGPTGKEKPKSLVCTVSTDASNISHPRSSNPSNYVHGDSSFDFPHWNNALMIHQDLPDSSSSSPQVEGPPHPLKLSPIFFDNPHPALSLNRSTENGGCSGGVSPGPAHSRCNSYGSQSSGASSTSADTFSPVYMLSDVPDNSPTMPYSPSNSQSSNNNHHLCPPTEPSFAQFQYPLTSTSTSAGAATQQSSPYIPRRESDHILNISYSRHSPPHHHHHHNSNPHHHQSRSNGSGGNSMDVPSSNGNGHRRAITEPQTLRALVNGYSGPRGSLSASISSNPIRVPSPPPVAGIDRDIVSPRKYSLT